MRQERSGAACSQLLAHVFSYVWIIPSAAKELGILAPVPAVLGL